MRGLIGMEDLHEFRGNLDEGLLFRNLLEEFSVPLFVLRGGAELTFVSKEGANFCGLDSVALSNASGVEVDQLYDWFMPLGSDFVNSFQLLLGNFSRQSTKKLVRISEGDLTNKVVRWVEMMGMTFHHQDESFVVVKLRDVTHYVSRLQALKEQTKVLERSNQELANHVHLTSHDLYNTLEKLDGYISYMATDQDTSPNQDYILGRMLTQTRSAKKLLVESLQLAEQGSFLGQLVEVDLGAVVQEAAQATLDPSVLLDVGPLPLVAGNHIRLFQLFRNLFENAVRHGSANSIVVRSEENSDATLVIVENDGIPVDPELLKGMKMGRLPGRGMKIIKRVVEAHGWELQIHNTGETTKIVVQIPSPDEEPSLG